mgnify:CR=1 FL=1
MIHIYRIKLLTGFRITIPKEVRERWGLNVGDEMEMKVEGDKLVIRPSKLPKDPVLMIAGIAKGEAVKLGEVEEAVVREIEDKLERGVK